MGEFLRQVVELSAIKQGVADTWEGSPQHLRIGKSECSKMGKSYTTSQSDIYHRSDFNISHGCCFLPE